MDSLTQLTLGAAVGEAVLGKKVGNRAMLWGAIGGTVPDLDVFSNMATDEISALAFHRAITHSFVFAGIAPLILGGVVYQLYKREETAKAMGLAVLSLFALVGLGSLGMPIPVSEVAKTAATITLAIVFFPLLAWGIRALRGRASYEDATRRDWIKLFFWAIFTHPLLDACTTYGTQLFRPFWDYRVAFNNISVADPVYTLPFLLLVIAALIAGRKRQQLRTVLNVTGLVLSSLYLVFTFYNKYHVHQVFRHSLERESIAFHRFMTTPTILNNILWQGLAEGDTAYYHGMYSILDDEPKVKSFTVIPKNHHLLPPGPLSRDVEVLKWFSNGYYSVIPRDSGRLQLNDLRFGSLNQTPEDSSDFVFQFLLERDSTGELRARQSQGTSRDPKEALGALWKRMLGN